jgi:MFS family permease
MRTFKLHLAYNIIEGIISGTLALNEFVFIKSLYGSNYLLSFLFQFSVIVLLPTIFTNELVNRVRNKKLFLRLTAIFTRLPLFILLFFPHGGPEIYKNVHYHYLFLFIFLAYFFAAPVIMPSINQYLKSNYSDQNFGKLYSYSVSANMTVILCITFLFGILLDFDNYAFIYIYPFLAFLGILSVFLLTRIDYHTGQVVVQTKSIIKTLAGSFTKMIALLRQNKAFRDYEIGFMIYGISFMFTISVVTIFLNKQLNLNYSSIALYKNLIFIVAILTTPFFGVLLGKVDPRKFVVFSYLFYLLHILFVAITEYIPWYFDFKMLRIYIMLIPSVIFYGLFTSAMTLAFYIGSSYFCHRKDAGDFQAVHLSFTGVRALFAPALGIYLYENLGYTGTFAISILTLFLSIALMYFSLGRIKTIITQ